MRRCGSVLCMLAFFAGSCFADAVILNNSSFQNLPSGGFTGNMDGAYEMGSVPGWTASGGTYGLWQPSGVYNYTPDGPTLAFITGGTLSQSAGTVQADQTYTLSVDIGNRMMYSPIGTVDLSINGVTYEGVGTAPGVGNWSTYTVTYKALQQDVGAQIYVQLVGGLGPGDFQDVQLLAGGLPGDPAPEPGSVFMALVGLGATYSVRNRLARRIPRQ